MADPDFRSGLQMVMTQGAIISILPIERWIEELQRADAIASVIDPTLYREWIYDVNSEVVPDILNAALAFKLAILAARKKVTDDMAKKARRANGDAETDGN